jgi:hypothetical protein
MVAQTETEASMRDRKRRKLTQAELRALGTTPGLMARRTGADGRARVEQLAPESETRRRDFVRRLAYNSKSGEGKKHDE